LVANTPTVEDLDTLPIPDYDDYFAQLEQSPIKEEIAPSIPFETSRGCWWGAKHHCTFCGLNGATMAYRSKTAQRALDELTTLTGKYSGYPVNVVDNILDMKYFKDFIPRLAERKLGLTLSYEVKANLTKEQLRSLWQAGIRSIQPGIESFSDEVLKIMHKGVRAMQNIQVLKWCQELEIYPVWNLLWGFPGESAEEYRQMANLIPLLTHLTPPYSVSRIRTDRFSPNYDRAEELGFKNLRPYSAYYHVYKLPRESLDNLAFHFTYEYVTPQDHEDYIGPVFERALEWARCHDRSRLFWVEKEGRLLIWDSRPIAKRSVTILNGLPKICYQACDQESNLPMIHRKIEGMTKRKIDVEAIGDCLDDLTEKKLILRQGNSYLALAVPRSLKMPYQE